MIQVKVFVKWWECCRDWGELALLDCHWCHILNWYRLDDIHVATRGNRHQHITADPCSRWLKFGTGVDLTNTKPQEAPRMRNAPNWNLPRKHPWWLIRPDKRQAPAVVNSLYCTRHICLIVCWYVYVDSKLPRHLSQLSFIQHISFHSFLVIVLQVFNLLKERGVERLELLS